MRFAIALLATGAACGACSGLHHVDAGIDYVRALVRTMDCRDGAPARILVDPHCVDGICGVTCAPGRWDAPKS